MSRFNFTLKYVPGTKIGKADRLSRRLDWKIRVENDNENQILIKDNWICSIQEVVIEGPEVDIMKKIKKVRSRDKNVIRIVEEMKRAKVKELHGSKWQMEGDLVLKEEKVYIPKDEELWAEIICIHHDVLTAGHGGRWKTVGLVTRNY